MLWPCQLPSLPAFLSPSPPPDEDQGAEDVEMIKVKIEQAGKELSALVVVYLCCTKDKLMTDGTLLDETIVWTEQNW
ncbi:hypothetical protein E2C01_015775 [Portunus trituberculatus]|uniref:Uncharacterized protein n=1 Tax=Portunus trituberculatus TaxID=210409 RepID=A0A5B7DMD0_PORTR|nr:hypothetical protein [Portunus trituberculatus]